MLYVSRAKQRNRIFPIIFYKRKIIPMTKEYNAFLVKFIPQTFDRPKLRLYSGKSIITEQKQGDKKMAVTTKEEIYAILEDNSIEYHLLEHDAVYTIDDMKLVEGMKIEDVCKNLFLRDERGKKHFLVVISEEKSADLKALREKLGTSRLGFASEDRLMKYLGLIKGAVTPLGVINDKECAVQVIFDEDLKGRASLGVHPCDNTATVFLSFYNLKKIIESTGHTIKFLKL